MSVTIRNLVKGEELPEELKTGFEHGSMPSWIWVAEREGKIVGLVIAAPAHIVAILLRLVSTPEAHPTDVRALLIQVMHDIKERGFKGYITWLDPTREIENSLLSIVEMAGGVKFPNQQVMVFGRA
jgi:hypothetical protein